MVDIIDALSKSGNKILEAAVKDFGKWKRLKHSKQDLELFLQFNIVHLKFKLHNEATFKEIVCTSNTRFIKVFSLLKQSEKKKALKAKNDGIRTKSPDIVMTYNLIDNKYNTIYLNSWEIVNFIAITEDNIELLDKFVNDLLKRPIVKDVANKKDKGKA